MNILASDLWGHYGIDWVGAVLMLGSIYLLGQRQRIGFIVGAGATVAFIVFNTMVDSMPMVVANVILLILNLHGWYNWSKAKQAKSDRSSAT